MATDPVCLMIVDEDDAKFTSKYRDHEYYFCCNWCKKNLMRIRRDIHGFLLMSAWT